MPTVKSLVETRIATTKGHIVIIPADTPTDIPEACLEQALLRGCMPIKDEAPAPAPADPPKDMTVADACRAVLVSGDKNEVTTDGRPKVWAVSRAIGRQVTSDEVIDAMVAIDSEVPE